MIIQLELTLNEVRVLGSWASLGRTLDNARRVAMGCGDVECLLDELDTLHTPLVDVATRIRNQIWDQWSGPRDELIKKYKSGMITLDCAVEALVALGWQRWKAKEMMSSITKEQSCQLK